MGTTLTRLKADDGFGKVWVLAIEGYPNLLTDGDPAAAVTAWAATDYGAALGGLTMSGTGRQEISPWGGKLGITTRRFQVMDCDGADTFGIDVFKKNSGNRTYLETALDSDDNTTISVTSSANFASSGTLHIGCERITYTSKPTATTFGGTITRGTLHPFSVDGGTANRFARHHALPAIDFDVHHKPIVSDDYRTWRGKWVGLWLHRIGPGGTWDTKAQAQLVFAGTIKDIGDTANGKTDIVCDDARGRLKDTILNRDQFRAKVREGIYIPNGSRITFKAGYTNTSSPVTAVEDTLEWRTSPTGDQLQARYYTLDEFQDAVNNWLANTANTALNTRWEVNLPQNETETHSQFVYTIASGTGSVVNIWGEVKVTSRIAHWLGFSNAGFNESIRTYDLPSGSGSYPVEVAITSDGPPFRIIAIPDNFGQNGFSGEIDFTDTLGTWVDQTNFMPSVFQGDLGADIGWGFLRIGTRLAMARRVSDTNFAGFIITNVIDKTLGGEPSDGHPSLLLGEAGDLVAQQVIVLEGTFLNILTSLLASTGTSPGGAGYNHATYDQLAYTMGAAIPYELLDNEWEQSLSNLDAFDADNAMRVIIEKPISLWEAIGSSLMLRNASLIWKNEKFRVSTWSTPHAAGAVHTFTENNKAVPTGTQDPDRTVMEESDRDMYNIVEIKFNRSITGKYYETTTLRDEGSIGDHGESKKWVVSARNTHGTDSSIQNVDAIIAHIGARVLPYFSRPVRRLKRTINQQDAIDMAPGDLCTINDSHARDPDTGTRGLTARPGLITSHWFNWENGQGEVEIVILDRDRVTIYSPAAQFNEATYSTSSLPPGASSKVTCVEHQYSYAAEDADAANFEENDVVAIIRIDPDDPAAAQSWATTVVDVTGNVVAFVDALTGIVSGADYRIVSAPYLNAQASQLVDCYQADDADGFIADVAPPYEYGDQIQVTTTHGIDLSELPERHANDYFGDGVPLTSAQHDALARMMNNLYAYKTCTQSPWLAKTVASYNGAVGGTKQSAFTRPIYVGRGQGSRSLTVAPFCRSTSGSADIRVTISLLPPSGTSLADPDIANPKNYVEWTIAAASGWHTPTGKTLDISVANFSNGIAWLTVEVEANIETRGLGECHINSDDTEAIARQWFGRNQRVPQSVFASAIAQRLNKIATHRRKEVMTFSSELDVITAGSGGTTVRWYGYTRTGYACDKIEFLIGMVKSNTAATDPYVVVQMSDAGGGGSYTASNTIRYGITDTAPGDLPNDHHWSKITYDVGENEIRDWYIEAEDYGRPFAICVYELSDVPLVSSGDGAVDPNFSVLQPILDDREQDLLLAGTSLWKRNGAPVLNWTTDSAGASPTFVAKTTPVNLHNGTSTGFATSSAHYRVQLTRHNTVAQTTVQVEIAVRAQRTAGAGATSNNLVGLRSASGIELQVTGINNTDGWYTATGTLPATQTAMELVVGTDAADTIRVDAVYVLEYEA